MSLAWHPIAQQRFARPAVVLAPMEGVHDAGMRALLTELGGYTYVVSEFLRISSHVPSAASMLAHVPELAFGGRTQSGVPVDVQLLGGHAPRMADSARRLVELGAQAIDLNFGCPAKTVNRHDGGAALLRDASRVFGIVSAVRAAVPAPIAVSAKIRLGWEDPSDALALAQACWEGGASWLTVHARTRALGYRPPALWAHVRPLCEQAPIPIVVNGDLFDVAAVRRSQHEAGTPHVMLGRGAVGQPWLGRQVAHAVAPEDGGAPPPCHARWSQWLAAYGRYSTALGGRCGHLPGRLKQWGMLAWRLYNTAWVERIKRLTEADAIVAAVADWEQQRVEKRAY